MIRRFPSITDERIIEIIKRMWNGRISKRFSKDDRIFDNLLTLNARFKKNNRSINFKRFFFQKHLQIDCVKSECNEWKDYLKIISRGNGRKTVCT